MMLLMRRRFYFGVCLAFCGLALASACNLSSLAAFLATRTPTPTSTPTATLIPTATATPTPSPTPLPSVALDAAQKALLYGDWDTALQEYQAVLATAEDEGRRAMAQFGLGCTYLRAGRYGEALGAFTVYLDAFPAHAYRPYAYFLRGQAYEEAGDDGAAITEYEQYLALRPGYIDSYVNERLGDLLRNTSRPLEAVAKYEAAIAAPRLGGTLPLRLDIGRAYLEAGDAQAALQVFDEVHALAGDDATKAATNLLAGRALEALGNMQEAYLRYLDSVVNYPQSYSAYAGLITLVEAGVPVDEFQRGYVDYQAGALEPARDAFDRYLAATPDGRGYYYRGLTRRALGDAAGALEDFSVVVESFPDEPLRPQAWLEKADTQWAYLGRYDAAVETYLEFVRALPTHASAAEALFSAGRTAERSGNLAEAAEIWLRIPQEYAGGSLAFYGAFEAGVIRYRLQDYAGAEQAFVLAETHAAGDLSLQSKAVLWIGKGKQGQGDLEGARLSWERAAAIDPTGYYSVRAGDLLAGRQPFQPVGAYDFSTDVEAERRAAEEWMAATFPLSGIEPLSALDARLASDPRMLRGREFWALGLFEDARSEFESLRKEMSSDPEALYRLMHTFLELPLYRSAILASRQILQLAGMDDAETMNAPVYFNHIRFGAYYADLILSEAIGNDLNGLLVLSLVRQESLFEGFATSYAAARGLMQVIPSTGQEIANRLGWPPGYSEADLYRPLVSVRFGTYYLAQQRDRFGGDLVAALAAYNGGPGNAAAWKEIAPDDADLFLEVIRLNQPHNYIRAIYEVFDIYRQLYANP
jgi:soluble lytic murein transglycosylase